MSQKLYSPKHSSNPYIKDFDEYKGLYKQSIEDPSKFFKNLANENISWMEDFKTTFNNQFNNAKWFEGGKTNISLNCIDRHLENDPNKIALIWEGDDPADSKELEPDAKVIKKLLYVSKFRTPLTEANVPVKVFAF